MGKGAAALNGSDTYCEIYDEFFYQYNEGMLVNTITQKLLKDYEGILNLKEVSNDFWFAIAFAQWECRELDQDIYIKVKEIILNGIDIEIWRELEASEEDLKERKRILKKFLDKISIEKDIPKKRKKNRFKRAIFEKGDCIVFKLENGNYGGSIVLEIYNNRHQGYNFIAKTNINKAEKPTITDFHESELLVSERRVFDRDKGFITQVVEDIAWFSPDEKLNYFELFEVMGNIKVEKVYDIDKGMFISGSWLFLIQDTAKLLNGMVKPDLESNKKHLNCYI